MYVFNQFSDADIIPIQVCHGEGRYLLSQSPTSGMNYCTIDGTVSDSYPVTPNGSQHALAAISNQQGNVFAIMPHPERSINQRRLPFQFNIRLQHPATVLSHLGINRCFKHLKKVCMLNFLVSLNKKDLSAVSAQQIYNHIPISTHGELFASFH